MTEKRRITLDLPIELHRDLKIYCAKACTSMRTLMIEALSGKLRSLKKAVKESKKE